VSQERLFSKTYASGDIVFSQGDEGDCAYIIETGRVEVFVVDREVETPITTLGPGEIFGEMAVIDVGKRSASVRALEDAKLTVVYREQLYSRIRESDAIVRLLISVLLKRMRSSLAVESDFNSLDLLLSSGSGENLQEIQQKAVENLRLERDIMEAIEAEHFVLNYQPIVNLHTGKLGGYEALVRWNHPTRGRVRPDMFLGLAEETSLIVPIGLWVMRQACEDLAKMQKECDHEIFMSINISGRQMMVSSFFDDLMGIVKDTGVKPQNVKLEITERILVEGSLAVDWINRCRELGFLVALDDFGTGYSSLSYLSEFDIDNLKIDQAFIRKVTEDHKSRVLVEVLALMARGLKLSTIAEGIEEKDQLQICQELNIDYIQGYFYGKPEPYEDAIRHLNADFER